MSLKKPEVSYQRSPFSHIAEKSRAGVLCLVLGSGAIGCGGSVSNDINEPATVEIENPGTDTQEVYDDIPISSIPDTAEPLEEYPRYGINAETLRALRDFGIDFDNSSGEARLDTSNVFRCRSVPGYPTATLFNVGDHVEIPMENQALVRFILGTKPDNQAAIIDIMDWEINRWATYYFAQNALQQAVPENEFQWQEIYYDEEAYNRALEAAK